MNKVLVAVLGGLMLLSVGCQGMHCPFHKQSTTQQACDKCDKCDKCEMKKM
jgi:hypothetical protein